MIDALRDSASRTASGTSGSTFGSPLVLRSSSSSRSRLWAIVRTELARARRVRDGPGAVVFVEAILKPIVDRHYICGTTLYYPSGTAAGVAAWTTLVWLLAVP